MGFLYTILMASTTVICFFSAGVVLGKSVEGCFTFIGLGLVALVFTHAMISDILSNITKRN